MLLLPLCPVILSFALTNVHFLMAFFYFAIIRGIFMVLEHRHPSVTGLFLSVRILFRAIYKSDICSRGAVETGYNH